MKFWPSSLLVVAPACLVAVLIWPHLRPDSPVQLYRTALVVRADIVQTVTASGTLGAVNTVQVGSQVSGNISLLHADFNDLVTAGQLLAEIEPSSYQAALAQAESDLASATAARDLKRLDAERARTLHARQVVADSALDQTLAELRQQEAAVNAQAARHRTAEVNLARTRIYAPVAGTVLSREVSVGQTVQANFSAPMLFRLAEDLRRMEISANVSEADIGAVAPGQPVAFSVDAFPGHTFTGEVRQIRNNPITVQNVVSYVTLISVSNEDLRLRPGMTASVTITTAHRHAVLRAPDTALRFLPPPEAELLSSAAPAPSSVSGPSRTAYLVQASGSEAGGSPGPLRPVTVTLGISDGTYTEILSGLREGDTLAIGRAATAIEKKNSNGGFLPKPPAGGPPQI
jgi:HlyD family secretion protein